MWKYYLLCAVLSLQALLWVSPGEAYQNDCLATLVAPTYLNGQSVPCSLRLDGGSGTHLLDLLGGEHVDAVEENGYMRTTGALTRQTTVTSGVTTNTTSAAIVIPIGTKSLYGQVVGTGAVTQTQAVYGDIDSDAANGVLLCTITLTGTTRDQAACAPITGVFSYYYVVTANTTGTGATGAVYAMY
jgi:hypothetical protein